MPGAGACRRGVARLLSRHSGPGSVASMSCLGLALSAHTNRQAGQKCEG